MKMRHVGLFVSLMFLFAWVGSARANSGTQIPLSQMQAGTEQTSPNIVLNGGFENVTSNVPNNWLPDGNVRVAAPQNPPPSNPSILGNFSAQALTNQPTSSDPSNYHQTTNGTTRATITFDQTKNYVLSAYIWNYGLADPDPASDLTEGDLALVELQDTRSSGGSPAFNLTLERNGKDNGDASNGYFVYSDPFPGTMFPEGATLDVRGDLNENLSATRPDVYAQFDNVAITPSNSFAAPSLVPEPGAIAMLALMLPLARRRR